MYTLLSYLLFEVILKYHETSVYIRRIFCTYTHTHTKRETETETQRETKKETERQKRDIRRRNKKLKRVGER